MGTDDFTVEYWVNKRVTTVGAGYNGVWGVNKWITGGSPGQNEWLIALGDANVDVFAFGVESGVNSYITGAFPLNINQWYQVVGIRNGDKLQLYVNGDLKQSNVFLVLLISHVLICPSRAFQLPSCPHFLSGHLLSFYEYSLFIISFLYFFCC